MFRRFTAFLTLLPAALLAFPTEGNAQRFNITQVGFTDQEHTRDDGRQISYFGGANATGFVAGFSDRYDGGSSAGRTAWRYDGSTTSRIGLEDAEHIGTNGIRNNIAIRVSEAGTTLGLANRYNGTSLNRGQSVWVYDGTNTINVGLTGSEFTRTDGYRFSSFQEMNDAGVAFGYSDRYDGNSPLGRSAWYFNGSSTVEIFNRTRVTRFGRIDRWRADHGWLGVASFGNS